MFYHSRSLSLNEYIKLDVLGRIGRILKNGEWTEVSFWKCTRKNCWSVFLEVASCASWFSAAKWDISRRLLFGLSPLTLERKSTHFSKPLPVQRKQWAAFKTRLLRHTFLIRKNKIRFVGFLLTRLCVSSLSSSAIFCQLFFIFSNLIG